MTTIAQKIGERMAESEQKSVSQHAANGLCMWEGGDKCFYPGGCSHSIRGGGPYFCRFHIHGLRPEEAARVAEESRLESNRKAYYKPSKPVSKN